MYWLVKLPNDVKYIIMTYLRKSIKEELKNELFEFNFFTFKNLIQRQIRLEQLLTGDRSKSISEETKNRIRIMTSLRCD